MATAPAEVASSALAPGARVGRYAIEARVGEGGAGTVYAARDTASDARVALKVLRRDLADDATAVARFEREARAIRAVAHPHIVPVLDVGALADGRPYLVMPLLDGRTLRDELRARGERVSAREAWAIVRPLATALAAAHRAGVVHRDVKPENVWLERRDGAHVPRLLDFGLAKVAATPGAPQGPKLTDTGAPVGTPGYMSPEQWWNQAVGPATDQYALGVMAFELLAARLPFESERYVELLQQHLSAAPPALASLGVPASEAVEGWLARTLAKAPDARFASMEALLEEGDKAFEWEASNASDGSLAITSGGEFSGQAAVVPNAAPRIVALALALAGIPALCIAGYAGLHDPRALFREAGFGIFPTVIAFALGLVWLARGRSLPRMVAIAPALFGTFGTYTGWLQVLATIATLPPAGRFEVLNVGVAEANVNRCVGLALAGTLALGALFARSRAAPGATRARREALAASMALALLAVVAVVLRAPSGALVAGAAALGAASVAREPRDAREALGAAFDHLTVVVLVAVAALTRVEARAAALWAASPSRATRAAEVVATAHEASATGVLLAAALVVTVALGAARVVRSWRRAPRPRATNAHRALAAVLAVWAALDVGLHARIAQSRAAVWNTLGPAFALFARLDPPSGDGLLAPHVAPALQLARDVVAIDSTRVALVASLDTVAGRNALALDLAHGLARDGAASDNGAVQLLVMADRAHPWGTVARALSLARDVGVRRAEVLLTRGPAPAQRASDPPEAAYALPRDFGAVRVELTNDGDAVGFAPGQSFDEVAADLARRAHGAVPLRLRVD